MSAWRHRFETRVVEAWYRGAWWLYLLWPLSVVFGLAVGRRQHKIQRQGADSAPVIVVGGITVGGTGKTPVVIALAEFLQARGFRVGVVSRGYGGSHKGGLQQVDATASAAVVGDEPLLIARRTGLPLIIGHDRNAAVQRLVNTEAIDVVLSDDGLQHYRLPRRYEIAVIDAQRGLGNGRLLPMGPLREPASRLKTVDWVLERNGEQADTAFHYRPSHFECWQSHELLEPECVADRWQGLAVAAVTALGQPQQFFSTLEALGLNVDHHAYPDHYPIAQKDLDGIKSDVIVMTEKDAVKLEKVSDPRIWVLAINADMPAGLMQNLVEQLADVGGDSCSIS